MSESNIYMIHRDTIPVVSHKYWYQLTYKPTMGSLSVSFDLANNVSIIRFQDNFVYNYDTIERDNIKYQTEYKVYVITKDNSDEDNYLYNIPYTDDKAKEFAKSLIGTFFYTSNQRVNITEQNYLNYVDMLIGKVFIDFSLSEKIISIIDELDDSDLAHTQVDISYFYEL